MKRRLLSVIKLLLKVKFIFRSPKKHEIVVFDDESSGDLENFIYNYNSFILQNRITNINKIYLSFRIIKNFFRNYNGNIMTAYIVTLLEIIEPKIVLTFIDNSLKFFDVAKILDNKIYFIAIQNGARYDLKIQKHLYETKKIKSDLNKNFYIPYFMCFGELEIEDYKKNAIQVKNFYKVGSLRHANFFEHLNKNKIKLEKSLYDICLISDPMPIGTNDKFGLPNIEGGFALTIKYTIQFCIKHKMKMVFAWKRDKKQSPEAFRQEIEFYKKYLNDEEFSFMKKNSLEKDRFASYKAMYQSKVVIATYSTLLREHLGAGGKILSCNCTSSNIFDFPDEGICSIKNCNFEEFEKRLLEICSISKEIYFSKLNKNKCYTMEYDHKISTIEILKNKIDAFLIDKTLSNKL